MPRLIDAEALYKTIDQEADFYGGFGDNVITASELRRCIEMVPTINAVPVVRCRDCKKGWPAGEYVYCMKPHAGHWPTHKWDWYCADGERKEDAK